MGEPALELRPGDFPITNAQLWSIGPWSGDKPTVNIDETPQSVVIRRFGTGQTVCREGEYGNSAFFVLSAADVRKLGLPSRPDEQPGYDPGGVVSVELNAAASLSATTASTFVEALQQFFWQAGTRGQAEPRTTSRPVASLAENELFGEMTAMNLYPRSATVVARGDCYLLEMTGTVVKGLSLADSFRKRLEGHYARRAGRNLLRSAAVFRGLPPDRLAPLEAAIRQVELDHGDTVYDQHDQPDEVYWCRAGSVKLLRNASFLVHEGDVRDWRALGAELLDGDSPPELRRSLRERLPDPAREAARSLAAGDDSAGLRRALILGLNALIKDRQFGEDSVLPPETEGDRAVRCRNRLLLEHLTPGGLNPSAARHGPQYLLDHRGFEEMLGDLELMSGEPRLASCVADGHVTLLALPRELVWEAVKDDAAQVARLAADVADKKKWIAGLADRPVDSLGLAGPIERHGLLRGTDLLVVDLDRCTHCGDCVRACAATHDGVARLVLDGPRIGRLAVPRNCRVCHDPTCMVGCPVGSIRRGSLNHVLIEDWCIGCGQCESNCPFDAIEIVKVMSNAGLGGEPVPQNKAAVCDLGQEIGGATPPCVYSCPHDALKRIDPRASFFPGDHAPYLREPEPWCRELESSVRAYFNAAEAEANEASKAATVPPAAVEVPPSRAEDEAFSSATVVIHYPTPVALAFQRFCAERDPYPRWAKLVKAMEATVKFLLFAGLSDLFDGLARAGEPVDPLLGADVFRFLYEPVPMTLGRWVSALRETARLLERRPARFLDELPHACRPGGHLDSDLLGTILSNRNLAEHTEGSVAATREDCIDLTRRMRPLLESAFREVRFLRSYPMGFVTQPPGAEPVGGRKRYRLHSCVGPRVADEEDAYLIESDSPWPVGRPFLVHPDGARLLPLWPFVLQRVAEVANRPTLYAFETLAGRARSLSAVHCAAIDAKGEAWDERLVDRPGAGLDWLLDRLRQGRPATAVSASLGLARLLSPTSGGRLVGRRLGSNELLAVIAYGGFGTVYEARDASGRRVAVKVLESRDAPRVFERFSQEFGKLRRATGHPAVIACYESGDEVIDGRFYPYISMELAHGGDLRARVEERRTSGGRLPWDDPDHRAGAVADFQAVAEATAHLHGLGIVHRDIKPSNVLVMDDGSLRLSDFGLAKDLGGPEPGRRDLTSTGAVLGTPDYMAPEQARGQEVDARADVYALGVLLAELATGVRPRPDPKITSGSALGRWPALRGLPKPLKSLVFRLTDVDPRQRPADARLVLELFTKAAAPPSSGPDGPAV
ncbi:MAG: protein kinase [Isosphaeraceae bacterium]